MQLKKVIANDKKKRALNMGVVLILPEGFELGPSIVVAIVEMK